MPAKIIGMIGTQQEGVAVHLIKGQISRAMGDRLHPPARAVELRFRSGRILRLRRRRFCHRALCRRPHRADQVPDRAPAGLGGAGAGGAAGRDLRPAHAGADVAAYHRRHQRRGPGQRRRLPAQERPLPPRRRVSRRDAQALDQRRPDRPQGRVLPRRGRLFRHQAVSAALPAAVLRRLVGRRAGDGRQALRRVRDLRRAAQGDAGAGRRISAGAPRPSGAASASTCRCGRSWRTTEGAAWDKAQRPAGGRRAQDRRRAAADQPFRRTPARLRRARRRP